MGAGQPPASQQPGMGLALEAGEGGRVCLGQARLRASAQWGRASPSINKTWALLQACLPFLKSLFVLISALAGFSVKYQDGVSFTLTLSPGLAKLLCACRFPGGFCGQGFGLCSASLGTYGC